MVCFLSLPLCRAAFEDETIDAGELISYTAMSTLGGATLGFSVLVLRLCRKEVVVVLTIVITVPFFVLVGTPGILSIIPFRVGLPALQQQFHVGSYR